MEAVYIETSVLSYLVAHPARNVAIAGHQSTTQDWWTNRKKDFRCYISQVVLDEISEGDPNEIVKRLAVASTLERVPLSADSEYLTKTIMNSGILPSKAVRDAWHIAVATVNGVQYILTWNCKHLANAQISRRIGGICSQSGFLMPTICTPEELLEEPNDA